jgi:hypothetical protein
MCYTIHNPRFLGVIMGWEQRGNKLYYYEKERDGKRVISRYLPSPISSYAGILQEQANETRELKRVQRQLDADIEQLIKVNEVELKRELAQALLAAGYHKHKGTWRKKRKPKN